MHIVMLLYPGLTQLDLTGPHEVFSRVPDTKISLAWKTAEPVADGGGLTILPTVTLDHCAPADILFVPGGPGQLALMEDEAVLGFLRRQAERARYVTSVCTGSLILGAAGLLTGHRATCHWLSLDQLTAFGAEPVAERVVIDGDRITGAGVTSGIDFALTLVAELQGERMARMIQLSMEYDPAPPFDGGSPKNEALEIVAALRSRSEAFQAERRATAERVGATVRAD
jgi:cyclohexyl-isocyanide hydratase